MLSRRILTFWDFYQKKKILSNVFLEWVSQAVVTMVAPETPSTEGRLAEVFYPFPFPSGCLALHRMPAIAQRSRCRNSNVTHHPEDHGVHCYSSVRRQEKSTTPLLHESVLCHRAVRMLIQRPRGDHLLLNLDLAKNKQLHWTKRLAGSRQGLSGQTSWLPEYEAAPPPEWEAYSLLLNKVNQGISLWPALMHRGRETYHSVFRFYGLPEGTMLGWVWLVFQRRNYCFVAWCVREWGIETERKDEVTATSVLRPSNVL